MKLRVRVVLSMTALGLFGAAPAAEARIVTCGEVITEDTVVSNDLDCVTAGSALVIGADDVTLNLNTHTVTAEPDFDVSDGTSGIRSEGYDGVVIRNGYVDAGGGFGTGILVLGAAIESSTSQATDCIPVVRGPDTSWRSGPFGFGAALEDDRLLVGTLVLGEHLSAARHRILGNRVEWKRSSPAQQRLRATRRLRR